MRSLPSEVDHRDPNGSGTKWDGRDAFQTFEEVRVATSLLRSNESKSSEDELGVSGVPRRISQALD